MIDFKHLISILFGLSLLVNAVLFLPQTIRILRTKSSQGVSLLTFLGFNLLQMVGIVHGYLGRDWALFGGMIASFLACGSVTLLTFLYRSK